MSAPGARQTGADRRDARRALALPRTRRAARWTVGVLLAASLGLSASGCTIRHKMAYDLHDVPVLSGGPFGQSAVQIEPFTDAREPAIKSRAKGSLNQPPVVMRDGDDWYCTADGHWELSIAQGVTQALAEHLRGAKLFGAVFTSAPGTPPQYVLRGTITRLEACRQREATSEAFVSQMGLIGLAIAATNTVDYDATVTLEDVRLIDVGTQATVWQGRGEGTVKGVEPIDAYGGTVFLHTTGALKAAVEQLVDQLAAVRGAPAANAPAAP